MQIDYAPFTIGSVSVDPVVLVLPLAALIVGAILLFSVKREVATVAIVACVAGLLLTVS